MTQLLYRVIKVTERLILDESGSPVSGYHIDYCSKSGFLGFVDVPKTRYTQDYVKQVLTEAAGRLEEIGKL